MMKKVYLLAGLALLPLGMTAQLCSYPLEGELPKEAVAYSLPQTVLHVQVVSQSVLETPGVFARYAERCLGLTDVIVEESLRHEIVSVSIESSTRPDPQRRYYLLERTPQKAAKKQASNHQIFLTPDGILRSINLYPEDIVEQPSTPFAPLTPPLPSDTRSVWTQEMQLANSTARMAELAAKQIFSLRETRLALLQGEIDNMPTDGAALSLYLSELDRMERAYTELFTGTRTIKQHENSFEAIPTKAPYYNVLFRFSDDRGVVDKKDMSGRPIYLHLTEPEGRMLTQTPDSVVVKKMAKQVDYTEVPSLLYYYVPVSTLVSVYDGQQSLCTHRLTLAQLGNLLRLQQPEGTLPQVVLDPRTGAIIDKQ